MDFAELKNIEVESKVHADNSRRLIDAQESIAYLRGGGMEQIMAKLSGSIKSDRYGKEKIKSQEDLALVLERAWPDLCRQVELELMAKARNENNKAKRLQRQIDSFFSIDDPEDQTTVQTAQNSQDGESGD